MEKPSYEKMKSILLQLDSWQLYHLVSHLRYPDDIQLQLNPYFNILDDTYNIFDVNRITNYLTDMSVDCISRTLDNLKNAMYACKAMNKSFNFIAYRELCILHDKIITTAIHFVYVIEWHKVMCENVDSILKLLTMQNKKYINAISDYFLDGCLTPEDDLLDNISAYILNK